jgi:hypothetical protein
MDVRVALAVLVTVAAGPVAVVSPVADSTSPTNATEMFRWGDTRYRDDFVSPVTPKWFVNQPRLVASSRAC